MAMDATLQIRMNGELKAQVEELYRSLGTSFVRIFAQQSLREGGMPFRPTLKTWDEMTHDEVHEKLLRSQEDIQMGRVYSQEDLDTRMRARFSHGTDPAV